MKYHDVNPLPKYVNPRLLRQMNEVMRFMLVTVKKISFPALIIEIL